MYCDEEYCNHGEETDHVSFALLNDGTILRGKEIYNYTDIVGLHHLSEGSYHLCNWFSGDDDKESLVVFLNPKDNHNESWYRDIILSKFRNRDELRSYLFPTLHGKYTDIDGNIFWFYKGLLHRKGGPAVIYAEVLCEWYKNGSLHRLDGPAIEYADGDNEWYQNGKRHRLDGPAVVCRGSQYWYRKDKLHREDGPAVINEFGQKWYQNNNLHRLDGPAVISSNGEKLWYIRGKQYTPMK